MHHSLLVGNQYHEDQIWFFRGHDKDHFRYAGEVLLTDREIILVDDNRVYAHRTQRISSGQQIHHLTKDKLKMESIIASPEVFQTALQSKKYQYQDGSHTFLMEATQQETKK